MPAYHWIVAVRDKISFASHAGNHHYRMASDI